MTDILVERLALLLSGLTEEQGRHLAMLITQGLAAASLEPDSGAIQNAIKVDITASASDLSPLSDRIVAEVLRQLGRSP
jgi:hypothetical protein